MKLEHGQLQKSERRWAENGFGSKMVKYITGSYGDMTFRILAELIYEFDDECPEAVVVCPCCENVKYGVSGDMCECGEIMKGIEDVELMDS